MRALVALLALASCATTPAPPQERLAGCWIDRDDAGGAVTMRWLPDASGQMRGELLRYTSAGAGGHESYVLRARLDNGVNLCQIGDPETCWKIAQGESGSLEGGRAFIDTHGEALRITVSNGADERLIFDGRRDGCD